MYKITLSNIDFFFSRGKQRIISYFFSQNSRTAVNSSDLQSGRGNFQQRQQPQPLLVPQRHPSASQLSICPPQQPEQQHQQQEQPQNSEAASISLNQSVIPAQQPKNIHINPHFRGPVVPPVQG